jgi:hypothetical protein
MWKMFYGILYNSKQLLAVMFPQVWSSTIVFSMTNCYHKIDRLVIAVPSSEQYLSYIQDENNFNNKYNYIEMREENMESRVWTNKIVFCSGYSEPTFLICKSSFVYTRSVALFKHVTDYRPRSGFPYYNIRHWDNA